MLTLQKAEVCEALDRLYSVAGTTDAGILPGVMAEAKKLGKLDDSKLENMLTNAFIPVAPTVGRFLYQIVRMKQPKLILEFGTSFAISTIHMAAALRDNGAGRLVTCEKEPGKVRQAAENIRAAGLADLVEIREGDAFVTAANLDNIDMLFLDGWKALYLPFLRQVEPLLSPGCVVIADDIKLMPDILAPYVEYVRDQKNGYVSVDLPLDDGMEISIR